MAQVKQAMRELTITRTFNAPPELVWRAWTDPEQLMRWWGPETFTSPMCRLDLREGGSYLYCMRSPDGKDYYSTGVFRKIDPPRQLVYTDSFADADGNVVPATYYGFPEDFPRELLVTVTFEEQGGGTKMTLRHSGFPADQAVLAEQGWNESLDKLAETLR
ncbi:MAG: SRPBCC family protein [Bacteroidota bacterium]